MNMSTNADASSLSTLGIKANVSYLAEINKESELVELSDFIETLRLPSINLGAGSNLTFCADYPGVAVRSKLDFIEQAGHRLVRVGSATKLDELVSWSIARNLSGLEALSLIPGTVGGAVALNAGAFGSTIADHLDSVRVYDISQRRSRLLGKSELNYWHRSSIFRQRRGDGWLILDAIFKLKNSFQLPVHPKINPIISNPAALRQAVTGLRSHLPDPVVSRTAGSFFLNPTVTNRTAEILKSRFPGLAIRNFDSNHQQIAAGWLLDAAGLRGLRFNGFYLDHNHANIVINENAGANGGDLISFISYVQTVIKQFCDLDISVEPLLIGEEFWRGHLTNRQPAVAKVG